MVIGFFIAMTRRLKESKIISWIQKIYFKDLMPVSCGHFYF
jgi:hypothetical protein